MTELPRRHVEEKIYQDLHDLEIRLAKELEGCRVLAASFDFFDPEIQASAESSPEWNIAS